MSPLSRGEIIDRVALGESLRGVNLVRMDLSLLDLARADFAEANLRMANLAHSDLRDARLTGGYLSGAALNHCNLAGANLVEASMIGAAFVGADLSRADLSGADLTGANLQDADLAGAYLVGTFLNETDLSGATLTGAYIRMAQMAGSTLTNASLEGADLSNTDLAGARLDGCNLAGANLTGANLSVSTLAGCNLRGADLTGATLRGCNLTGAKLRDIKFVGVKLDDAWADWVDLGVDDRNEDRALLEEAFVGIIGKPIAQVLVEGRVSDDVWAMILAHLCEFQVTNPEHTNVRLRGIHQGISSSAFYLEAENEMSLAAYLAEFAGIIGKGADEFFEKLAAIIADESEQDAMSNDDAAILSPALPGMSALSSGSLPPVVKKENQTARFEALQRAPFWKNDKAFLILTSQRQIWLEATSNPALTLRPPHGSAIGIDLVRGHFIADHHRRNRTLTSSR